MYEPIHNVTNLNTEERLSRSSGGVNLDVLGAVGFRACYYADPRGVRRFPANVARSRDKWGALLQAHAHRHRHRQIRQHKGALA